MKITQNRPISPNFVCISLKLNKFIRSASLFAIVLGIFLLPKTALMAAITPEKIISSTNEERNRAGLNILSSNDQLARAANAKAQAVLASQIFDHTINGKKFSSWIKDTGYRYSLAGENLAMDFVSSEGLMRAWMASPDHRANILENEYADIGVGVAEGKFAGQKTIVVAQIFGDPLIKTAPIPADIVQLNERIMAWKNSPVNHLSFYYNLFGNISLLTTRQVALF
ncbi:MAG: CAP domain-containing protein [Patescibacteria group bacterium]|nr:CAP domain-containing protein [Patescibacteria group bacterium]